MSSIKVEKTIRGEVAYWSAMIETVLIRIILASHFTEKHEEVIKFKNLTFKGKIDKTFSLLKEFHPEIYLRVQKNQDELNELRKFRNLMIHCKFEWNENDLTKFKVWDITTDEERIEYLTPIDFEVKNVIISVERLKEFTFDFIQIIEPIDSKLRQQYPALFQA
jgi:hypothetical protein